MTSFKNFLKSLRPALMLSLIMLLICGLAYPLLMTGLSNLIFPHKASGSLIEENGRIIGSETVGQEFTKPYFMKGRPSAVHYNTYSVDEDGNKLLSDGSSFTSPSSGSQNLGPSNPALSARVKADMDEFLKNNPGIKPEDIPTDLLTASGSGLDPHISPESAEIQLPAISACSGISMERLKEIVEENTEGKLLGIFGRDRVNVLGVNIEISREMGLT